MAWFAVELSQAEKELGTLIQNVGSGAEVVITRDGEPIARIVPADPEVPVHFDRERGSARGMFVVPDDFGSPIENFSEYM